MNAAGDIWVNVAPITRCGFAIERLERVRDAIERGDNLAALRTADSFAAIFSELLADVAQEAYNAGESKAAIARALGVTPATFRGMVRS
jgi:hypothetical protein